MKSKSPSSFVQREAERLLRKIVPPQYSIKVRACSQNYGQLIVSLGDGSPECPVSGILFCKWLESPKASYEELQRNFSEKTGCGIQMSLGL